MAITAGVEDQGQGTEHGGGVWRDGTSERERKKEKKAKRETPLRVVGGGKAEARDEGRA